MRVEKLSSGSYRVRKMVDGISVSVTFDHKPKETEIMKAVLDKLSVAKANPRPKKDMTIEQAIKDYVEYKKDKMSVTTQREYLRLPNRLSEAFLSTLISDVDQFTIDDEIMRLKGTREGHKGTLQPKTIKNYIDMATTAIKRYRPKIEISKELVPDKKPTLEEPYIPTSEEMVKILAYTNENDPMFYIPISLAAICGLRRSEICSLKVDDIDDENQIHIDSALVQNDDNEWVDQDDTKTVLSTRLVPIPEKLAQRIKLQGYIYNGNPNSIGKALKRIQKELGFQTCSLHKLRYFFATELADREYSEADILYLGGWSKGSTVMKMIYRQARIKTDKERRQKLVKEFGSSFFD